jgi:S1-C subfamily serine protease
MTFKLARAAMIGAAAAATVAAGAVAAEPGAAPPAQVPCRDTAAASDDCRERAADETDRPPADDDRARRIQRALHGTEPLVPGRRLATAGTGFAVAPDGQFLTNRHVVAGCAAVSVTPADADPVVARVVAADAVHDLALLKAAVAAAAVVRFADREPPPGAAVSIVGYPTHGLVAIVPIQVDGSVYPQPPAADRFLLAIDVRRGNSGGPVFDRRGAVVGVVVAEVDTPRVYAMTGRVVRDVGVAIRPAVALDFLRRNAIVPATTDDGPGISDAARLEQGRRSVAQIGCWR